MIPKEFLTRIRRIELRTAKLAEELLVGTYHSVFRGRGIDFEDVRAYQPGDEVRCIDWNVTARTGIPHVRRYREERELSIIIALDLSASGLLGSGSQTKRELAAEIASVLAFSALKNNDRIALVLVTDTVELFIPPGKGQAHVFRIIRDILFFQPKSKKTALSPGLDFISGAFTRRAVVFVISDFLDPSCEKALTRCASRHDTMGIVIYDRRERELPNAGWMFLEDAETSELIEVDTGDKRIREAFRAAVEKRATAQKRQMQRAQVDFVEIETGSHYHLALRKFFERRASKR